MAEHSVLVEKHPIVTEKQFENESKYSMIEYLYTDFCKFSHIHLWFPHLNIFRLPLSSSLDFIDANSIKLFVNINACVCTRNEYLCVDRVWNSFNSHFDVDFTCIHRCHQFPLLQILLCDRIQSMCQSYRKLHIVSHEFMHFHLLYVEFSFIWT